MKKKGNKHGQIQCEKKKEEEKGKMKKNKKKRPCIAS